VHLEANDDSVRGKGQIDIRFVDVAGSGVYDVDFQVFAQVTA